MTDDAPLFPDAMGGLLSAMLNPEQQDGPPYVHSYRQPEPEPPLDVDGCPAIGDDGEPLMQAPILPTHTITALRCPCGHPLDLDGDPDQYGCLNGRIYGPCGDDNCYGRCDDTAGRCQSADGCCDPENREEANLPPRRCTSEACDEEDGIHCYGDGCAMVRKEDQL